MLGFFRRHQKSFMLIFLVPGLLAMGITGAVISVVQNRGDQVAGTVFGEPIYLTDFDHHRQLYRITNPRSEDEEAWRFLAFLKAAERAGLEISDTEIREGIHSDMKWSMARYRAMKRIEAEGIDSNDPRIQRLWQQYFFEELGKGEDADKAIDVAEYKKYLQEQYGVGHRTYEEQQRRELLVRRFLDTLRAMATVDAAEVEKAYQDKHHLRVADLVSVPAARYVPSLTAKEGDPGFISDDQIKAYYQRREIDFDEPRRVDMDYVAITFKGAEDGLKHPGQEALRKYNERRGIFPVSSFSEFEERILESWYADKARSRAMDVMEQIEDEVAAARKAKPDAPVDLKAIAGRVRSGAKVDALEDGRTGLTTEEDLTKGDREFLSGYAVDNWFMHKNQGAVSGTLANMDALILLQTREVKHARTPKFEDIKDAIRKAYANGTDRELREFYDENKNVKYRKGVTYHVELATYSDADFGGDHAKAVEAAEGTLDVVEQLASGRKGAFKDGNKFDMYLLGTDPAIKKAMKVVTGDGLRKLSKEDLEKHPQLAKAADAVPTASAYRLRVVEFDGGVGLWRLVRRNPVQTEKFEDIRESKVRKDLQLARGLERAEEGADALMVKLKFKTGDELKAVLAAEKLELETTKPFDRNTVSLEGLANAGSLVGECFAASAEVGGTFEQWVTDPEGQRVLLVRVASRQDAPAEGFEKAYPELREELLRKERGEFAQEQIRDIILEAKGISPQHMAYATKLRDGPGGVSRLKIRQIFLPPDPETTDAWLDQAAKGVAEKALAELRDKKSWSSIVQRYSEHQATRTREGELPPSSKQNLADTFGNAFAEEAYAVAEGEAPRLIKSNQGYHLVKLAGESKGRKIFRHILISTDPKRRKLPKEIEQAAETKSKAALEAALAALERGESFAKVAEEYGDADDPLAQGKEFEVDYATSFERAALAEPFEWELSIDDPRANDPAWVPDVVEVKSAKGTTYHLFACTKESTDRIASWDPPLRRDRLVFHIESSSRARVESARAEMIEFMREGDEDGDRPSWFAVSKRFKELAAEYSEAPDANKGGAVGLVRLEDGIRGYGDAFLERMGTKADGAVVTKGYRTGVFRGEKGYHLIEVVDVTTSKPGDRERAEQVAELVLNGTGWQ